MSLRYPAILVCSLLIAAISCKKGDNSPGQTNPQTDTAYLFKTDLTYSYDSTGSHIQDSSVFNWTYDAQNRISTYTSEYTDGTKYSETYSYTANQKIVNEVVYWKSTLLAQSKIVYYLNTNGRTDSSTSTGISNNILNGITSSTTYSDITYYHYDANGNNVADSTYDNTHTLSSFGRRTYSNNSLISGASFQGNGMEKSTSTFLNGNVVADTTFDISSGMVFITRSYTYLPTLSGGFYTYTGTTNLLATFTQTFAQGGGMGITFSTYTYTFDKANRVSTVSQTSAAGKLIQKDIFIYY